MGVGWGDVGDAGGHDGGVLRLCGGFGSASVERGCGGIKALLDCCLPLRSTLEC